MPQSYIAFGGGEVSRRMASAGVGTVADPIVPLIGFGDTPSLDSFGRLLVSNPEYVFDAQLTYDLQPLLYEQITAQSGATVTHDATNRCALMTFASTPTGGQAIMQSYEHFRYEPGRDCAVSRDDELA